MKRLLLLMLSLAVVFAFTLSAAPVDGKWSFEYKAPAGKKGGDPTVVKGTLELKADGDKVTGKVVMSGRRRDAVLDIKEGKISGNKVSFVTVQETKKGSQKLLWSASIDGDTLNGTRTRESAKRGQPFTAKRAQ